MSTILPLSGATGFSTLGAIVFLVKATVILLAAFGITRVMHRSSAGARHLVWLVALGALLLVPALTAWSPLRVAILPATSAPRTVPDVAAPTSPATPIEAAAPATAELSSRVPATSSIASVASETNGFAAPSWPAMLLALWALIALGIVASLAWAALAVRRIVRRASELAAPAWRTPLFEIADRYGLDEAPRLLKSDDVKMPFACGVLTPTIVLPAECEQWTRERRHAVLLHELAHVRRHDLIGHTIGRLACAAYWFHPLVWSAARALRSESERACDDLALACGTDAPDYAEHLLDIVTSVRRDATPLVALAMARRKEFEGRMLAILDPELPRSAPSRRQSVGMIATLALLAVTVGAAAPVQRAPQETHADRARARAEARAAERVAAKDVRAAERVDRDSRAVGPMQVLADSQVREATREVVQQATREQVRERMNEQVKSSADHAIEGAAEDLGAAVGATASTVVRATVPAVIGALLRGGDVATLKALQQQRTPDERAALLAKVLATDTSASLRRVAAWGLNEYATDPAAVEALTNAVRKDANASVREMAAWALSECDDRRANVVDALAAALHGDASTDVRATAAWALGNAGEGSRGALDALTAALGDADAKVRTRALWAIGNIEPKQLPRQVLTMLMDGDARVRELAAWAVYQSEDATAVPAVRSALESEQNKEVQLAEIRALAALGEQSVDAIRGLLDSPDPRVRSMAVHALAGGQAAGPWPRPWPQPRPYP